MKKSISIIASIAAAAAITTAASAYDINTDLGFGWSTSVTIGAEEFADVTTDTTVTITYNVNQGLASMEGQDYWCIKPMVNDAGWPFINNLNGAVLSEGGDSYVIEPDSTSMSFTIPAAELEHLQVAGMAIMGHGIELLEMTFADAPAAVETPTEVEDTSDDNADTSTDNTWTPADDADTSADDAAAADDTAAEAPADTTAPAKGNPDTGVSGIAALAGAAIIAAGAMFISRRK